MPEFKALPFAHFDRTRPELAPDLTASPPYDVLSKDQRDALAAKSPFNMTHIDLPPTYELAAATLGDWLARKAMVRGTDAYYLLATDYDLEDGRLTRWTVFGGLRLAPWGTPGPHGKGAIHPHEKTYPKHKTDRLSLMRATKAQLSPILGVFDSPDIDLAELGKPATDQPPLAQFHESQGVSHRLWQLPEASATTLRKALPDLDVYIADGHHRYETALAYREERGPGSPDAPRPWDYVFAGLCNIASEGVVILPYHRQLTFARNFDFPAAIAKAQACCFDVTPKAAKADLDACADEAAFLLHTASGDWLFTPKPGAMTLSEAEKPFARIGAYVFDHLFCESVLGLTAQDLASGNYIKHTPFGREARAAVEAGQAQAAAILEPVHIDVLRDVSHAGLTMPRKSTYFYPKLPTGLLVYLLEE